MVRGMAVAEVHVPVAPADPQLLALADVAKGRRQRPDRVGEMPRLVLGIARDLVLGRIGPAAHRGEAEEFGRLRDEGNQAKRSGE